MSNWTQEKHDAAQEECGRIVNDATVLLVDALPHIEEQARTIEDEREDFKRTIEKLTHNKETAAYWIEQSRRLSASIGELEKRRDEDEDLMSGLEARIEHSKRLIEELAHCDIERQERIAKLEGLLREAKKYTVTDLLRRIDKALGPNVREGTG